MARTASQAYKHYQRALAMWPKDNLRPDVQFQEFLQRGVDKRFAGKAPVVEQKELAQVNALYSLAEDRYIDKFPLPLRGKILNPRSQSTYFQDLLRELEEAPTRTWLQAWSKKLSGMFRWE